MTWLDTVREGRSLISAARGPYRARRPARPDLGSRGSPHPRFSLVEFEFTDWTLLGRPRPACGTTRSRSASSISSGPACEPRRGPVELARAPSRGRRPLDSVRALLEPRHSCRTASRRAAGSWPTARRLLQSTRPCSPRQRSRAVFSLSAAAGSLAGTKKSAAGSMKNRICRS